MPAVVESEEAPVVFVSYASPDAALAASVVTALEAASFTCWIAPRNVTPGSLYADEIVGAINACKAMVLVLSEHAVASTHVGKEIERASSKRRPIIALRVDAAALTNALEYFLSESQWIDLKDGTDTALTRLIQAVQRHVHGVISHRPRAPLDAVAPRRRHGRPSLRLMAFGGIIMLALSLTAILRYQYVKQQVPTSGVIEGSRHDAEERSIAVLPFEDLSEKHDQQYFADGLSQELVNVLGRLAPLRVIEHGSSFRLRGQDDDPRSIGAKLGAAYIVRGSVRRTAGHVRATIQLIRAADGSQQWSGTFDRQIQDLLQVQAEIAMSIARSLQLSVGALEANPVPKRLSAEAYDLYLRGMDASDHISEDGFREAEAYLQQALKLDPDFIRAREELAKVHLGQAVFGAVPSGEGFGRLREDATQLLQLDPRSGWAETLLCRYHTEYSWDWPEAERQCAAAVALAPRFYLALYASADLAMIRGDYAKSERSFRQIFTIDPLNADTYIELGLAQIGAGSWSDAVVAVRHGLAITPTYMTGHFTLGRLLLVMKRIDDAQQQFAQEAPESGREAGLAMVEHAQGRQDRAAALLAHFIKQHGREQPYVVATVYAYVNDVDQAFAWLDHAYQQKDPLMPYIKGDPEMQNLRADPRYPAFLRKVGLPE